VDQNDTIYDELGVRNVINGVGTRTQISGTLMREEAAEAMQRASEAYAHITDLQARASELISDVTGAESGYVTTGAASGLVLATAACIAGSDYDKMANLPHTEDISSDVVIPQAHCNKYARMFEVPGGRLKRVGVVTHHPVNGGSDDVSAWEIDSEIDNETVAVAYHHSDQNLLSLQTVVDIAHDNDVPVIVDAADVLPPKSNLRRFTDIGADLVTFAGGKGIRGPQSTGILAGREDLIQSVALQQLSDGYHQNLWKPPDNLIDVSELPGTPPIGFGRPMKVGKEEIIGLMAAIRGYVKEDEDALISKWKSRADRITTNLNESDALNAERKGTSVIASLTESADRTAVELIDSLRSEDPRIWIGENRTHLNEVKINVKCLGDHEADYLVERMLTNI